MNRPNNEISTAPSITVQIVHIEGPSKGEINEFDTDQIIIGRHPSSDIVFPRDLLIISRKHASISREGNRFLLKNFSPNGCTVNGKSVDEIYLKQGDVITFAEGGPKVSFLYTINAQQKRKASPAPAKMTSSPGSPALKASPNVAGPAGKRQSNKKESAAFTVQFETSIKSYKQHAIIIGQSDACDFTLKHAAVSDKHAEILYHQGSYFLRDVSGISATYLNDTKIQTDTPLQADDIIQLNKNGPAFVYLGDGRLVEQQKVAAEVKRETHKPAATSTQKHSHEIVLNDTNSSKDQASVKGLFKSFFKK